MYLVKTCWITVALWVMASSIVNAQMPGQGSPNGFTNQGNVIQSSSNNWVASPPATPTISMNVGSSCACNSAGCYGACYGQFGTPQLSKGCDECSCKKGHFGCDKKGCKWWLRDQDYFLSGYEPPCPGFHLNQMLEIQKVKGRLAQYVFSGFHFDQSSVHGTSGFTSSGRQHLYDISRMWPLTPGPITIRPSGNAELDQSRMYLVYHELNRLGVPIGFDGLGLGNPLMPGISGIEAIQIYNQRLQGSPLNPVRGGSTTSSGFGTGNTGSFPSNR